MRSLTPIEFCRDAAARFQLLADIEPWPSLRKQYGDFAAQYRTQAAALLKERQSAEPGGRQRAA